MGKDQLFKGEAIWLASSPKLVGAWLVADWCTSNPIYLTSLLSMAGYLLGGKVILHPDHFPSRLKSDTFANRRKDASLFPTAGVRPALD